MRCPFYGGGRGVVFVKLTRYAGHVRFEVHFEVRGEHRGHRGDGGGAHLARAGALRGSGRLLPGRRPCGQRNQDSKVRALRVRNSAIVAMISSSFGRKARSVVLDRWQPTMQQRHNGRSSSNLSMNIAPCSQPMKFLLSRSIEPSEIVVYPPESNKRLQRGAGQLNASHFHTSDAPILASTPTNSISTCGCLSHKGLISRFILGPNMRISPFFDSTCCFCCSTLSLDSTRSKE